jgi:hypothetical protein
LTISAPGTYYLDEEVWTAVQNTRRRIGMVFLAILALFLIGVLVGTIK